jgi:hypothetical protein
LVEFVKWNDYDAITHAPLRMSITDQTEPNLIEPSLSQVISVCANFAENGWTEINEIWCGHYAIMTTANP